MSWILFIIVLTISFVIVRIGAIAFQLTGLEWSLAKFQSLSCFTGTGFTTKEAELITGNRQRRRIASILMVLGNAGLVMMIATFANSLSPRQVIRKGLEEPLLPFSIPPGLVPWINLLIIVVAVYVIYKLFTNPKFSRKLTNALRVRMVKKEIVKPVFFEELAIATGGYGVSRIEVGDNSSVLNKKLFESELKGRGIMVLAITRQGETTPNPSADTTILLNDELICFGKLENIRNSLSEQGA